MVAALLSPVSPACAQPPSYDFDFVTIGAVGNAPWLGNDPLGLAHGRGRVDYEYRIGRLEVTTSQWMEFANTYSILGGSWTFFAKPTRWGAEVDPTYSGPGQRYRLRDVSDAARIPVNGITWRTAAQFANWLHNDKAPSIAALQDGAYDISTFSTNPNQTFNDQLTHHPGAKYWIPTLDEWIKAAHYDPNRYGAGQGGYWEYKNSSDSLATPGLPGVGETSAGLLLPNGDEQDIPLGAYFDHVSPWGLWDTSGGMAELLEEAIWPGAFTQRLLAGSYAGDEFWHLRDQLAGLSSRSPNAAAHGDGLRIASSVPTPGVGSVLICLFLAHYRRPIRRWS
jgi:hypothetical protein